MPAGIGFCSICLLAGAAPSPTNATENKISVMRNVI
jgi:hypothetical protein